MVRARGKKSVAAAVTEAADGGSSQTEEAAPAAVRGWPKRTKTEPKPKPEPEYFPPQRNLEDLWLSAFPVGTEGENIDKMKEFNWNFENLEKALEEGEALWEDNLRIWQH